MTHTQAIIESFFGNVDGKPVSEFILTNNLGSQLKVLSLGGIVRELLINDKNGQPVNVNLGFDTLEPYLTDSPYFGAIIGRVGNRIANASFSLDGKTYALAANNGPNNLHGGPQGFDRVIWRVEPFIEPTGPGLMLRYRSPEGDQGFPGNVNVTVRYQLTHENVWAIEYTATTDKATPINLTQHAYLNLRGEGDVLDHHLTLAAEEYTPVDQYQIPTCAGVSVENTPFDFRAGKKIGTDIAADHEQIKIGQGYDHNYLLPEHAKDQLIFVGKVTEPTRGISVSVYTTEPCVQLYTGNFLDGSLSNNKQRFERFAGFCLETQHLPDSPNQLNFPSIIVQPGETYKTTTQYKFST